MNNSESNHLLCALVTFRAQYENEILRQQIAALTQEIERLKGDRAPEAPPGPRLVKPEGGGDAAV